MSGDHWGQCRSESGGWAHVAAAKGVGGGWSHSTSRAGPVSCRMTSPAGLAAGAWASVLWRPSVSGSVSADQQQ